MRIEHYHMSLSRLTELGTGRQAAVYALDDRCAVKLFFEGCPASCVDTAFACGGLLHRYGVPVPRMIERCMVNGRQALIMERIDGQSMLQSLFTALEQGGFDELLAEFAGIHRSMLGVAVPDAPALKGRLRWQLKACGHARLLPRLDALPDGGMLCHGDFHPANVLMCGDKPFVIDFMSCSKGAPILDIARSYYLMSFGACDIIDDALHRTIGATYLRAMGVQKEELEEALPVVMAARLSEEPSEAEREVIDQYLKTAGI